MAVSVNFLFSYRLSIWKLMTRSTLPCRRMPSSEWGERCSTSRSSSWTVRALILRQPQDHKIFMVLSTLCQYLRGKLSTFLFFQTRQSEPENVQAKEQPMLKENWLVPACVLFKFHFSHFLYQQHFLCNELYLHKVLFNLQCSNDPLVCSLCLKQFFISLVSSVLIHVALLPLKRLW